MPTPKWILGTPRSADSLEHLARGGKGEGRVVRRRQRAGPAVEELDRRGAGGDLGPQRREGDVGEAVGEAVPELGLGVHEGLRPGERARRAALDEVARERERRAGEADQRHVQLADDDADRLEHVGEVRLGLERSEAVQVSVVPKRHVDHRPTSGHDLDPDADRGQGHDDVREQDGGVDPVTAYRLQGELGGELRLGDGVEDVAVAAERPVLGQRPARLAHEPHRCALDARAATRPQERRVGGQHGTTVSRRSARASFASPDLALAASASE